MKHCFFREDADNLKLPRNMADAKALATVLSNYKDDYFYTVVLAFFYIYVLYPFIIRCFSLFYDEQTCISL